MSIELRNISKRFGEFAALSQIDLVVPDGKLVALLGPSGSGKTTLLRIIAGLETFEPEPGSGLYFHDQDVARAGVGERHVGFVFQHYALFRHMTVYENIAFGLRVRRRGQRLPERVIRAKVTDLLRLIQLDGLERRYPAQLSGGQRQRVALARALAIEPKVLLLDEPFGALDAKVRQDLRRWLRRLHDTLHITSVFVTHDQDEALELADQIVVMNKGRIEQVGTPDEVFHHPASPFVMEFLGNVNLFRGRIEAGKAIFGSLVIDAPPGISLNGDTAQLCVRPYDLEIHAQRNGKPALPARVGRIQSAGPLVRVELRDDTGQPIFVEMSHERFREQPFAAGADVFVSPRDLRMFVEDYSI